MSVQRTDAFLDLGGFKHHLSVWDGGGSTTVLCLHGFLDLGQSWSFVVDALPSDSDWHIVAPDWRGHGQTDRVGPGGYYHFADYVRDLDGIIQAVARERLILVAHSMGALVASMWLAARPEGAAGLVMVEGLGPPPVTVEAYPDRVAKWLDQTSPFKVARFERPMKDLAVAERRLSRVQPRATPERIKMIAKFGTIKGADGLRRWRYDPLHRTSSPLPLLGEQGMVFWRRLTKPVLWIGGTESEWLVPKVFNRIEQIPAVVQVLLPGAGHMVHTEAPEALATELVRFVNSL